MELPIKSDNFIKIAKGVYLFYLSCGRL